MSNDLKEARERLEAVAWRVKDFADGYFFTVYSVEAAHYAETGHLVEPLCLLTSYDQALSRARVLTEALERVAKATPNNTNSRTAFEMMTWTHAVASCALHDAALQPPAVEGERKP